jgi:hypothetical protein
VATGRGMPPGWSDSDLRWIVDLTPTRTNPSAGPWRRFWDWLVTQQTGRFVFVSPNLDVQTTGLVLFGGPGLLLGLVVAALTGLALSSCLAIDFIGGGFIFVGLLVAATIAGRKRQRRFDGD